LILVNLSTAQMKLRPTYSGWRLEKYGTLYFSYCNICTD